MYACIDLDYFAPFMKRPRRPFQIPRDRDDTLGASATCASTPRTLRAYRSLYSSTSDEHSVHHDYMAIYIGVGWYGSRPTAGVRRPGVLYR